MKFTENQKGGVGKLVFYFHMTTSEFPFIAQFDVHSFGCYFFAYNFPIMWEKLAKYFQGAGEEMDYKVRFSQVVQY